MSWLPCFGERRLTLAIVPDETPDSLAILTGRRLEMVLDQLNGLAAIYRTVSVISCSYLHENFPCSN